MVGEITSADRFSEGSQEADAGKGLEGIEVGVVRQVAPGEENEPSPPAHSLLIVGCSDDGSVSGFVGSIEQIQEESSGCTGTM